MSKKTKISFENEHIRLIVTALEVYYRLRSGQISMALDNVYYDKDLSYDESHDIEKYIRNIVFPPPPHHYYDHVHEGEESPRDERPNLHENAAFGFNNKEMKDATLAYEISKVLEQYLSVSQNNGYFGSGCNFNDPLKATGVPLPEIEDFDKYKLFPLKNNKAILKLLREKNYIKMWDLYDKQKTGIPHGEKWEIIEQNNKAYVRIFKPRKK